MKVTSNQKTNTNFNANLLAQWKCKNSKGATKNIVIAALEKDDLSYFENLANNLHKYDHFEEARKTIIKSSINTIKTLLKKPDEYLKKVKMLLAIYNGKACGILVANIPKESNITDMPVYSSRHNPAKNETEIDWLVSWNPKKNENLKGVGKALVGEYYRTLKNDKFRDVYVRSEIPENSTAQYFYEALGFESISSKRKKIITKNSSLCFADKFSQANESVIPMIVTASKHKEKAKELAYSMCRQEFIKNSINIKEIVE